MIDIVSNIDPYGELTNMIPHAEHESAKAAGFLKVPMDLLVERGKDYDKADGTTSMDRAVAAFNALTGHTLSESEGTLLMILLKLSRQWADTTRLHKDSLHDAAAYIGLMSVSLEKETAKQEAR